MNGVMLPFQQPELIREIRNRLIAKLRQEQADINASAHGDGELPYSFQYQQMSPVQNPTEWMHDAGRTY